MSRSAFVPGTPSAAPVPLIVLTGFLGAGKTTLLNRVLGAQHHRRVAVLVNELGRIDIDASLIRGRAGDVLELAGGCVCHQIGVQRELWSALEDIVRRSRPDVVVLETTGIAEPQAIWDGLAEWERERRRPRRRRPKRATWDTAAPFPQLGGEGEDGDGADFDPLGADADSYAEEVAEYEEENAVGADDDVGGEIVDVDVDENADRRRDDPDSEVDRSELAHDDGDGSTVGRRNGTDTPRRPAVYPAATVTVVDAEAAAQQLQRHEEARAQIAAADRIVLSKVDRASAEGLSALHQRLHAMNPAAERVVFPENPTATAALVDWFLDTRSARAITHPRRSTRSSRGGTESADRSIADANTPSRPDGSQASVHPPDHDHPHQLAAAAFTDDLPLLGEAVLLVCHQLGDRLIRAKGFVHLAGEPRRGYLEKAGSQLTLELRAPWAPGERRVTEIVMIGDELDATAIQRQLWGCRAPVLVD